MKFKPILVWALCYEIFTWLWIWSILRTPWTNPFDGSTQPTTGQVILTTHGKALGVFAVLILGLVIIERVWNSSNRRRGGRRW